MLGMFGGRAAKRPQEDARALLEAASRSLAMIEFSLDGTILSANQNFLSAMGYDLDEIVGQHHRLFVLPAYAASEEYRTFWDSLRRGEHKSAEYLRLGKGGREIWIQATYNPVLGPDGTPTRVMKFATDISAQKRRSADFEGQLAAISKSQAVIEFTPAGEILTANQNFLTVMGYRLEEIAGRSHAMFVPEDFARTPQYRDFWAALGRGEYRPRSSCASARVGAKSGSRRLTIRSSMRPAVSSRWSNTPPTSPPASRRSTHSARALPSWPRAT